jgi:hypothetical protein
MKNKISILVGLLAFAAATLFGVASSANASLTNPPSNQRDFAPLARVVTFDSALRVVNDTNSTAIQLPTFGTLDLQYVVVGNDGSTPFTMTIQYSNDGTNWATGATLFTNATSTANSTNMTRTHNFGGYTRVAIDTTNSTPLTLTINALAK